MAGLLMRGDTHDSGRDRETASPVRPARRETPTANQSSPFTHAAVNRASVIRSDADFSPRSYRHSGSPFVAPRHEYAAGPACNCRPFDHVLPSSSLTRTVIFSRLVLAGLLNSSRTLSPFF